VLGLRVYVGHHINQEADTMKTVKASSSTAATSRKRMTKTQRVQVLDHALNTIHDTLADAMEALLDTKMVYEDEETVLPVLESHLRTLANEQKASAEFLQLGRIFVEVDDLLHGPEYRQIRIKERRAELKAMAGKAA
jgi:hypothetical protein